LNNEKCTLAPTLQYSNILSLVHLLPAVYLPVGNPASTRLVPKSVQVPIQYPGTGYPIRYLISYGSPIRHSVNLSQLFCCDEQCNFRYEN